MNFNPVVLTQMYNEAIENFQKYIPQPVLDLLNHVLAPVDGDEYGRSQFTIDMDEMTGVSKHQLDQRAGLITHEIVPLKQDADWVDRFEAWLDFNLSTFIHRP